MAQIHNTMIRALNASWNHAASVQPSTQEAVDFLLFNQQLFTTLDHHHKLENEYLFPKIEEMLNRPGAMEEHTKGRAAFGQGLTVFQKYVFMTKASEYHGATVRHIIESFAPSLIQHLHDEITALVGLHMLDSTRLLRAWKEAGLATNAAAFSRWTLGCQDRSFTIDGEKGALPNVPWIIETLVRKWHAKKYAGAWKFCPSDLSGTRRQLIVG